MMSRVLEDEDNSEENAEESAATVEEAEYHFEGYEVDFSERIALTPAGPKR